MNINLEMVLSQLEDGENIAKLFDMAHSPESRWEALQDLIESSPRWRARVKWCLAMKGNGESDGDILSWLINNLDLVGPFNVRLNARLLRSMLKAEQVADYEEGFGWLLSKQQETEEAKPKKLKRATKGRGERKERKKGAKK